MPKLPFLQYDPRWKNEILWDRKKVLRTAKNELGLGPIQAKRLLQAYPEDGGNSIMQNEGCQLCCLAMVLHILDADTSKMPWNPKRLLAQAQKGFYLTRAGLALTPLYADLCVDMTDGRVQLCAQEDYVPGSSEFKPQTLVTSHVIRAWRSLPLSDRSDFVCMLRIGTHDQTANVHYLLLNPEDRGAPDSPDALVLDPDMPEDGDVETWSLMDAAEHFALDREDALQGVKPGDIAAVYLFARWASGSSRTLLGALGRAIALQG